jgi:predicted phosphodiesterase
MRNVPTLQTANQIAFIGDVHGDLGLLLAISRSMQDQGIHVLLALGDLGLVWGGGNWSNRLSRLSNRLSSRQQVLYWVDGNHDDHRRLAKFPVTGEGLRPLRPNVIHLPRGYRTRLATGMSLLALGGAHSIDYSSRKEGVTFWPEESISEADLATVGHEHADVMVGHDAPLHLPSLDKVLARNASQWPADAVEYADRGRRVFHRGFLQASPILYLGGHYHEPIDETLKYGSGSEAFRTRVVLLDEVQNPVRASSAILEIASLHLTFFSKAGRTLASATA